MWTKGDMIVDEETIVGGHRSIYDFCMYTIIQLHPSASTLLYAMRHL